MKIVKYNTPDRVEELLRNLGEAKGSVENGEDLKLSRVRFVYPISLLPIVVYAQNQGVNISCSEDDDDVCGYLHSVCFPGGTTHLRNVLRGYLPITQISCDDSNDLLGNYEERILSKLSVDYRKPFLNSLKYLTSELEANVREHSEMDNYWIFAQYWPQTKTCEIALCDSGIGIKQSYEGTRYQVDNDEDALKNAFCGKSSKSNDERGTGLPSIARLFVEGYEGVMIVMSGDALLYRYKKQNVIYNSNDAFWKGVFVGLRFKLKELSIYKYL